MFLHLLVCWSLKKVFKKFEEKNVNMLKNHHAIIQTSKKQSLLILQPGRNTPLLANLDPNNMKKPLRGTSNQAPRTDTPHFEEVSTCWEKNRTFSICGLKVRLRKLCAQIHFKPLGTYTFLGVKNHPNRSKLQKTNLNQYNYKSQKLRTLY